VRRHTAKPVFLLWTAGQTVTAPHSAQLKAAGIPLQRSPAALVDAIARCWHWQAGLGRPRAELPRKGS
jgi:acyl-CoA synthetase (NDP forming)